MGRMIRITLRTTQINLTCVPVCKAHNEMKQSLFRTSERDVRTICLSLTEFRAVDGQEGGATCSRATSDLTLTLLSLEIIIAIHSGMLRVRTMFCVTDIGE